MVPSQKVTSQAVGAAITALVFWLLGEFTDIDAPAEIVLAGSVVVGFVIGFWVRETRPAQSAVDTITRTYGVRGELHRFGDDRGQASPWGLVGLAIVLLFILVIVLLLIGRI